jgi:hypothetical protein
MLQQPLVSAPGEKILLRRIGIAVFCAYIVHTAVSDAHSGDF